MAVPGTAGHLVELLPIAFVPRVHCSLDSSFLDATEASEGSREPQLWPRRTQLRLKTVPLIFSRRDRTKEIFRLMFQTRQLLRCFARPLCFKSGTEIAGPKDPKRHGVLREAFHSIQIGRDSTCTATGWPEDFRKACENPGEQQRSEMPALRETKRKSANPTLRRRRPRGARMSPSADETLKQRTRATSGCLGLHDPRDRRRVHHRRVRRGLHRVRPRIRPGYLRRQSVLFAGELHLLQGSGRQSSDR